MPPPQQRKEIGRESSRSSSSRRSDDDEYRKRGCGILLPRQRARARPLWITECCRWRTCPPLSCLLFLVLFVFVSCVVPLSTPSSTHVSTTATLFGNNNSFPNTTTLFTTSSSSSSSSLSLSSVGGGGEAGESGLCPTAKLWIKTRGSFCYTLRDSPFLKNATELSAREERAIAMFCELDFILEKVDCAQPYSVNVDRRQCWLCREAYRDWVCAMSTDTLEDGQVDCEGGVMPCPSCASICHQVMRLCPYLTPDRVQFDDRGDPTPQVSQYGGHPAFYCPLENIHASDPAYSSDCNAQYASSTYDDPDYVHNLCAADAKFMSKRSVERLGYIPHYSTCCWTYASSLVQYSGLFEKSIREHGTGYYRNRVILNCCDSTGNCDSSDPQRLNDHDDNVTATVVSTETPPLVRELGSTLRTANNQVRGEDGKFMELKTNVNRASYMQQDSPLNDLEQQDQDEEEEEEEEEDDDEEYYDDSSSTGEIYSGSSNEHNHNNNHHQHHQQQKAQSRTQKQQNTRVVPAYSRRRYYNVEEESSSSVISIHRDNKIYVTRESRSVHDTTFYLDNNNDMSSGGSSSISSSGSAALRITLSCLISALIPPLVMLCCVNVQQQCRPHAIVGYWLRVCCERFFEHVIYNVSVFRIVLLFVGGGGYSSGGSGAGGGCSSGGESSSSQTLLLLLLLLEQQQQQQRLWWWSSTWQRQWWRQQQQCRVVVMIRNNNRPRVSFSAAAVVFVATTTTNYNRTTTSITERLDKLYRTFECCEGEKEEEALLLVLQLKLLLLLRRRRRACSSSKPSLKLINYLPIKLLLLLRYYSNKKKKLSHRKLVVNIHDYRVNYTDNTVIMVIMLIT